MTLIKENKVRKEIPNRMMSATFALPIDERRVVDILDYVASDTGITPMAFGSNSNQQTHTWIENSEHQAS